jgi:thiamine biosynthesis lipoprotein
MQKNNRFVCKLQFPHKPNLLLLCIVMFFAGRLTGCSMPGAEPSRSEYVLGTVCTITLYDQGTRRVYRDIFSRLREIENLMSVNLDSSDIARVNAAAGLRGVKVHPDVFTVIDRALHYAAVSSGAFDPAIGPLVSLWGIGGDAARLPSDEEIAAVLPLVNWRNIASDRETSAVFLKRPGMALDLGAIAKGYAADQAAAIIRKAGIKRAIIDLGGNILVYGEKKDKSPWSIGIQEPSGKRGAYIGILRARDKTVVTSGVYERFVESGGVRSHHILSPADGRPARSGLLSVSIVTDQSIDADALSTAVFVLGYEQGKAMLASLENAEGIFVFEDMSVRLTGNLDFTLTDGQYRIVPE